MTFTVLQCQACRGPLEVVSDHEVEHRCPRCRYSHPVEAYRWLGCGLERTEALRLADEWNARLERGLSWSEAIEFKRMVPA